MVDSQAIKSNKQDTVTLLCSKFISGKEDPDKRCSSIIYHQNIHGLKGKINESMLSLEEVRPHLTCLTEHHLKHNEIDITHIPTYNLGAKYCRSTLKMWGVCIYIFTKILHFLI